jgi:class 3 adenylate cyclase/tetratricopeptide (TPR) repeat protein
MIACPQCGAELPDDARFCLKCGGALASPAAHPEERKVLTTLFCDLVAFTAHSEASDHELIDGLLHQYNDVAKRLVEAHGGVVEKYIGDAVVAAFGFPAAHDDDAERAVRCALRLAVEIGELLWPDGDEVQVHIGVNTGETYLHTDVEPSSGASFLTGDAVNTAARLEAASPANGIVVGELTHELTKHSVTFEELAPLAVKGKREPVRAWLVREASDTRSRTGLRTTSSADTPFLGRESELSALLTQYETANRDRLPRFVLLAGEAGIGKSRLVLEFARRLDAHPELITWRQGRCLTFGDESGFAALSDIVEAHAAILDSDDTETVEAKLEAVLPEGDDRVWLRQRLRPLLGLESDPATQEESFAAWRRFLAHVASSTPTVLVFEDVHWAGEAMFTFLEQLTDGLAGAVLVLATARPEVFAQHPDAFCDVAASTRLTLSPLSRDESERLVSHLLEEELAPELGGRMVEQIGGNPLYAEEYVRLLLDRGLLMKSGETLALKLDEQLPLPGSVQAVLAARLDTLAPEHKALLCDAAVFGEAFWEGGLQILCKRSLAEVHDGLTALVTRQLIREANWSSLAGETEYLFWHALARDVAYGELPKRVRVEKHVGVADWLDAAVGDRAEEFAETLAYHTLTGMELAQELGQADVCEQLRLPAVRHLTLAGDRAMRLNVAAAVDHYARAAGLTSNGGRRASILVKWAESLFVSNRAGEAAPLLEEAVVLLQANGDPRQLAVALAYLSRVRWRLHDPREAECFRAALEAIGDDVSPESLKVLGFSALHLVLMEGDTETAVRMADRALGVAAELGMEADPYTLGARAAARAEAGDRGGIDDFLRAVDEAEARGLVFETCQLQTNLAISAAWWEGPEALTTWATLALPQAKRCGSEYWTAQARTLICDGRFLMGEWDGFMTEMGDLVRSLSATDDPFLLPSSAELVLITLARGTEDVPHETEAWLMPWISGDSIDDRPYPVCALAALAVWQQREAQALGHLKEGLLSLDRVSGDYQRNLANVLPWLARAASCLGRPEIIQHLVAQLTMSPPFFDLNRLYGAAVLGETAGGVSEAAGQYADAAAGWHDFGVPHEEAQALLGQGRCLVALGRAQEAVQPLQQASEIFKRLGAKPALVETEEWLAKTH